ncbi:tetratricopeptide repeat protein [Pseudohongiella sp. SYSU M77423]|uniref:tetratricopeptide repeat protein n=1 Tax=Pseudohongiella sp. SYSU M77423 TaxID=3042312 RepID=UPI0024814405|nr:tetratricopeptide repeat protein [Pseudohongiella sp. SYSU M77423]MDH7942695.1 tetratricopeptide repeat protein [Pseudohongiella sp. SYSU M77423]
MSLINDMLRDLDARRRDAPSHGAGPEKLVPASPSAAYRSAKRQKLQPWLIVLAVMLLATLVTAYWFLRDSGLEQRTLAPVPMATNTVESDGSSATQIADSDAEAEMIRELERRLQDLERQNQALASQQASPEPGPSSSGNTMQSPSTVESVPGVATSMAPAQAPGDWQPRNWETDAQSQSQQQTQTQLSQAGPTGTQETQISSAMVSDATSAILAPSSQPSEGVSPPSSQTQGIVREQRPLSLSERDRREVQMALEQWADGQRMAALQTLDSFIYREPEAHLSRELLAKLLIQQGEPERALQAVELGLRISPNQAAYKKIKARLLVDSGQTQEAADVLSQRPPALSADIEYHDMLATALLASQNFREAINTYQALLSQNDAVGRWWYGLAVALDTIGRRPEAADAYQQAARREDLPPALREQSRERLALIRAAQ